MRVIICGGGTAGHVTPGIAIAETILKKAGDSEIIFVGRDGGEENLIVENSGFTLVTIKISGFDRKISVKNIKNAFNVLNALKKAKKLLRDFTPDIVIGTGGYVCWPVLKAAQRMKIKTVIHESNGYPGLTTRLLSPSCDRVLLNFGKCKEYLKRKDNVSVVGNPLRTNIIYETREHARRMLKLSSGQIFVLSFGGSGGSDKINSTVISLIKGYSAHENRIKHLHATGRKYYARAKELFPELTKDYFDCKIIPFIDNMPLYLRAADIVICRAGAMTLSEISAAGVASILIPSPNVTDNHQYVNARLFFDSKAAVMIEEKELTEEVLKAALHELINNKSKRDELSRRSKLFYTQNSREIIFSEIERLTEHSKNSALK